MDIHACCYTGDLDRLQQLIAEGMDTNSKDNNGDTPLHIASNRGHLPIVQELLAQRFTDVNDVNVDGDTPLHKMAYSDPNLYVLRELLHHGANINAKNNAHNTVLHLASIHWKVNLVKELIHHNANINDQNYCGATPLFLASLFGQLDVVKELIYYSDCSIKDHLGNTALTVANTEKIRQFIQDYLDFPEIKEPEE